MYGRCGSNAVSEGLALGKRMICVPISTRYSRGEQSGNALYAVANGTAVLLEENELCVEAVLTSIQHLLASPIKPRLVLTEKKLKENCMVQIKAILDCGRQRRQRDFLKCLRHGGRIKWESLDRSEMSFFEEISEEYEFCG